MQFKIVRTYSDYKCKIGSLVKENPVIMYTDFSIFISPREKLKSYDDLVAEIEPKISSKVTAYYRSYSDVFKTAISFPKFSTSKLSPSKRATLKIECLFKMANVTNFDNEASIIYEKSSNILDEVRALLDEYGFDVFAARK